MTKTLPLMDNDRLIQFLVGLLNTPSPTGRSEDAVAYVEGALQGLPGIELQRTRK